MNQPEVTPITNVETFLAHALELELEAVERYQELADSMATHNNPAVAALFREQIGCCAAHVEKVRSWAEGLQLPQLAPWSFQWNCPENPECLRMELANYLMEPRVVLTLALHNEIRGRDFYGRVAASSPNPEVRRLAGLLEQEESEHLAALEAALAATGPAPEPVEDFDPPNSPF